MKKIMIATCAIAFAVVSQAASINWSYTGAANDTSVKAAHMYCIVGDTAVTQIDNWATWLGAQTSVSDAALSWNSMKKWANGNKESTAANITKDKSYYFVLVNSDQTKFQVSGVYAGNNIVYDVEEKESQITTNLSSAMSTWKDVGNVPEPTSAMLMLIGVAGLALRRRRA